MNCVGEDLDVTPNAQGSRRQGHFGLQTLQHTLELKDVWRHLHPQVREITHTCPASRTGGRIDKWLASQSLLHLVIQAEHLFGWPGDHLAVSITFISPKSPKVGPGPWTFPPFLLDKLSYVSEAKHLLTEYLQDHAVTPSHTRRQRWDSLKQAIRDHATEWARVARMREKGRKRVFEDAAKQAGQAFTANPTAPNALERWQASHHLLQTYHSQQAEAAAARAGVLWQHYGEQSTFYYYHLTKQRLRGTTIPRLADPAQPDTLLDLSVPTSRIRAGQVLRDYFSS